MTTVCINMTSSEEKQPMTLRNEIRSNLGRRSMLYPSEVLSDFISKRPSVDTPAGQGSFSEVWVYDDYALALQKEIPSHKTIYSFTQKFLNSQHTYHTLESLDQKHQCFLNYPIDEVLLMNRKEKRKGIEIAATKKGPVGMNGLNKEPGTRWYAIEKMRLCPVYDIYTPMAVWYEGSYLLMELKAQLRVIASDAFETYSPRIKRSFSLKVHNAIGNLVRLGGLYLDHCRQAEALLMAHKKTLESRPNPPFRASGNPKYAGLSPIEQMIRIILEDSKGPFPHYLDDLMHIGCALHAAHEKDVYHLDIKPENIFVCHCGTAALGDWDWSTNSKSFSMDPENKGFLNDRQIGTTVAYNPYATSSHVGDPLWYETLYENYDRTMSWFDRVQLEYSDWYALGICIVLFWAIEEGLEVDMAPEIFDVLQELPRNTNKFNTFGKFGPTAQAALQTAPNVVKAFLQLIRLREHRDIIRLKGSEQNPAWDENSFNLSKRHVDLFDEDDYRAKQIAIKHVRDELKEFELDQRQ